MDFTDGESESGSLSNLSQVLQMVNGSEVRVAFIYSVLSEYC